MNDLFRVTVALILLSTAALTAWRLASRFITPTTETLDNHQPKSRGTHIINGTFLVIATPIVVLMLMFMIVAIAVS